MSERMHSGIVAPAGIWWKPAAQQEKRWVTIAFIWCLVLFAMMPLWHIRGGQNPTGIRAKVSPQAYRERVERFIKDYKVEDITAANGMVFPVVAPPPGAEVYLLAKQWDWSPVLKLKKGVEYTIHLSSADVNHGFSLLASGTSINIQVVPGYDYALKMTPNAAGDYRIVCNEFCGIGHHIMIGKILVEE